MSNEIEHVDVLIVGAGLSGVGAACHLRRNCPQKTFAILEAREATGGTWDLFRYPGLRSDSDMFTLGYRFRPWMETKALADGESILRYIRDTARDERIEDAIRLGHRVVSASWSTQSARWTVFVERNTGETIRMTCGFLYGCTGYYRYDEGYSPDFAGTDRFRGQIVHPQHWPDDLDYTDKRVVVIGSGATAVTLVPAMADRAAHVTMLQRSPSYVVSIPARDVIAVALRRVLPPKIAYAILRWKNVLVQMAFFQASRRFPRVVKRALRTLLRRWLPAGYVDEHFTPSYDPWDQRVCVVPDGDLFRAIRRKKASVVTDRVQEFTERGVRLESGDELEADIVVTATGLNLLVFGGIDVEVDGRRVDVRDTVGYKGMMFSGIPNLAVALGYTNASFTLKCDLVSEHLCRLLSYMDANGYASATPREPDPSEPREPFIELQAGYVLRSIDQLPKQGARAPWRLHQNYARDIAMLKRGPVAGEGIEFAPAPAAVPADTDAPAMAA